MSKMKKRNTNRRSKPKKKSFCVADWIREGRVAFLDSEFVTSQQKGGPPSKLVSVGLVICQKNFEEVERFHSYIFNDEPLHDKFRELTNITEEMLLRAPSYEQVMREIAKKITRVECKEDFCVGTGSNGHRARFKILSHRCFETYEEGSEYDASTDDGY